MQRDALRLMRSEIGMTQSELANELNVSFSTVNRWENREARPNKAISVTILALAKQRSVSADCLDALTNILLASRADDRNDKAKTDETVQRLKQGERVLRTGSRMKMTLDNLDLAVTDQLAAATPAGAKRDGFERRLSRRRLLDVCKSGDSFGSAVVFNTIARRWMRVDRVLLMNPYAKHIEAAIYVCDVHNRILSTRLMNIFAVQFFEYIGMIDNEKETFYSAFLHLRDGEGRTQRKKVACTYLDETHTMIAMAQGDTAGMSKIMFGETPPGVTNDRRPAI